MIRKSRIREWRTPYHFQNLIKGTGKWVDSTEQLRVYACEVYIKKFLTNYDNKDLALHDAIFITEAKDERSQRLLLKKIISNEMIVRDGAYNELKKVKEGCRDLLPQLQYESESSLFKNP